MNSPEKLAPKQIAAEFLFGELIKAASKRFKALAVPYMELKQSEQATLLRGIEDDVRASVREAVEIIASDYRVVFRAGCESVAFKADGVKSQLTMHNTEAAHALADAAGNTVLVVIEDGCAISTWVMPPRARTTKNRYSKRTQHNDQREKRKLVPNPRVKRAKYPTQFIN